MHWPTKNNRASGDSGPVSVPFIHRGIDGTVHDSVEKAKGRDHTGSGSLLLIVNPILGRPQLLL